MRRLPSHFPLITALLSHDEILKYPQLTGMRLYGCFLCVARLLSYKHKICKLGFLSILSVVVESLTIYDNISGQGKQPKNI